MGYGMSLACYLSPMTYYLSQRYALCAKPLLLLLPTGNNFTENFQVC